eukprot:COSAG05_NODE_3537_length_2004_cov_4.482168_2_plen_75_part_00
MATASEPLLRYEGDAAAGAAGADLPAHVLLIDEEVLALRCVLIFPRQACFQLTVAHPNTTLASPRSTGPFEDSQ